MTDERGDCGAYHVRVLTAIDTAREYYYDAAGGALVAVYAEGMVRHCVAGPSDGLSLECPGGPALSSACVADAGSN